MADEDIESLEGRELSRAQIIRLQHAIRAEWRKTGYDPERYLAAARGEGDRSLIRDWFTLESRPYHGDSPQGTSPYKQRLVNLLAGKDLADVWRYCCVRG